MEGPVHLHGCGGHLVVEGPQNKRFTNPGRGTARARSGKILGI